MYRCVWIGGILPCIGLLACSNAQPNAAPPVVSDAAPPVVSDAAANEDASHTPPGVDANGAPARDAASTPDACVGACGCLDSGWQIEDVPFSQGNEASVAVDSAGNVHLALSSPELKHFERIHSIWQSNTIGPGAFYPHPQVAVDTGGGVHIVAESLQRDGLRYAYRPAGGTFALDVFAGSGGEYPRRYPSLLVDRNNGVHIAYFDPFGILPNRAPGVLRHEYKPPGRAFSSDIVTSAWGGRPVLSISHDRVFGTDTLLVLEQNSSNTTFSVSKKLPDGSWNEAFFSRNATLGTGNIVAITGSSLLNELQNNVIYIDGTAVISGSFNHFSNQIIDNTPHVHWGVSSALYHNERVGNGDIGYVLYVDSTSGKLVLATSLVNISSFWNLHIIDSVPAKFQLPAMMLDTAGNIHLTYIENNITRYAFHTVCDLP